MGSRSDSVRTASTRSTAGRPRSADAGKPASSNGLESALRERALEEPAVDPQVRSERASRVGHTVDSFSVGAGGVRNESSSVATATASRGLNPVAQPIQRVLINPGHAARNAQLTRDYHAAETSGDTAEDHGEAIGHYQRAQMLRRQAGRLHHDQDGGHLTAIDTLGDKIGARRARQGPSAEELERRRAQRAAVRARDAAAPAVPTLPQSIGSAADASFLKGRKEITKPGDRRRWFE